MFEVNLIGIRREISRENPRFSLKKLSIDPFPTVDRRNNLHRYNLEHTLQKEVSQCRERLQTQTRTIEITGRPELLCLSPSLIFYRSPAIHPISVNLNLAQTTRASSILARHFPERGIELKR